MSRVRWTSRRGRGTRTRCVIALDRAWPSSNRSTMPSGRASPSSWIASTPPATVRRGRRSGPRHRLGGGRRSARRDPGQAQVARIWLQPGGHVDPVRRRGTGRCARRTRRPASRSPSPASRRSSCTSTSTPGLVRHTHLDLRYLVEAGERIRTRRKGRARSGLVRLGRGRGASRRRAPQVATQKPQAVMWFTSIAGRSGVGSNDCG